MLSDETLEEYRKMTVAERLSLTFAMMRDAGKYLTSGPADVVLMLASDDRPQFFVDLVKQGFEVPELSAQLSASRIR